jgi:hypothetical protein
MRYLCSVVVLLLIALSCPACEFFFGPPSTFRDELARAAAVVCGRLTRVTPPNPDGPGGEWITDLAIDKTLKKHAVLAGRDTLAIPRQLQDNVPNPQRFLVFIDFDNKGRPDPYRGYPLTARSDLLRYVEGILKIKDKKPTEQLRFYFAYLHHAEEQIARDALLEFERAAYKDYRAVAESLPAERLRAWLRDPATRAWHLGLYGSLLGHCSKKKAADAKLLRSVIEDHASRTINAGGIDRLLAACVMLQPKEGWEYLRGILRDPGQEFTTRYAALRAVRFFVDVRADIIAKKDAVEALTPLLDQPDIADLVIGDLRHWKCWQCTEHILAVADRPSHDIPITQRAVLRFALCSPHETAKQRVAQWRLRDPETVRDAEELLQLEQEAAKSAK